MAFVDNLVSKVVLPLVPKAVAKRFASRYVPGETLEDALAAAKKMNSLGMCASLDILGEYSTTLNDARSAADEYKAALVAIAERKIDSNISVKPTHLGLKINSEKCFELYRELCAKAAEVNNWLRIDMENSATTQATIDMYARLRKEFDNVGLVVQAYLRRTHNDVRGLLKEKTNLRLCKGVYVEPRDIAYKDMEIINNNFISILETILSNGGHVGIATHDERLVYRSMELIERVNPAPDSFEFQMLWGVDDQLRDIILATGHKLRMYIPYGREWYAYSMRRLKENPKLAGDVFRSALKLS
jgi:proline dehydrogenase